MHDRNLVMTAVSAPYTMSDAEEARILESLRRNGVAAATGFMPPSDVQLLRQTVAATTNPEFTYGGALRVAAKPAVNDATAEFHQPFLVSNEATRVATNKSVLQIVEKYLGETPIIHHGLLQVSFPLESPAVDWHIDCGSNKALNGSKLFRDKRLRTILYLTDVDNGGLGFICDTASIALDVFLSQPVGQLFPTDKVPPEADRRIEINALAGTLIFFDTHSLHRPEAPKHQREVLNIWFARRDFAGKLPPTLFSMSRVPPDQQAGVTVFETERGHDPIAVSARLGQPRSGFRNRVANAIRRARSLRR